MSALQAGEKLIFKDAGTQTSQIPVRITYRIIELFSDGLYASPNKAIEELVANSFDAGAENVHVIVSPDRSADDACIIVVDDGQGMDEDALKTHWLIGVSNKRQLERVPRGRKQIGKFGIGKLATFALANELTHICKKAGKYYAVTMDYRHMPAGREGGVEIGDNEGVNLPLRELSEAEARESLGPLISGTKPGYTAIALFGPTARETWTVAIMSSLKDLARNLQIGRLSWVLKTSMPLRADFRLFLNGDPQESAKLSQELLKKWVLGKDLTQLGPPASDEDVTAVEDPSANPERRWRLDHPRLGSIFGFAEVYDSPLTTADNFSRSHGFFVYVRDRLINAHDAHFGIPANALRHGTFSRFRLEVHVDVLDGELRSTREAVRDSTMAEAVRNILRAVFNAARTFLDEHDSQQTPGFRAWGRIKQSPGSLTRRPILQVLTKALEGQISPRLLRFPTQLHGDQAKTFLAGIEELAESEAGLVNAIELADLSLDEPMAVLDIVQRKLLINLLHPFVAAYQDSFEKDDTLALLCMAEVLTEAYLYDLGLDDDQVRDVMSRRDELQRQFSRSMKRTANIIARDLLDAVTSQTGLEREVVAAFNSLGFEAVHLGGKGKPDGVAVAHLSASEDGARQYSVNLEAKSKERLDARVGSGDVDISRITYHSNQYSCDHAIVVGPDFATTLGESCALITDARRECENTGKTITFIRAQDLARLVRIRPIKHVGLDRLKGLFERCVSPEESERWVNDLETESQPSPPYREILETIWELQKTESSEEIEFAAVKTALRIKHGIEMSKDNLANLCKALAEITPEVVVRNRTVELNQRPDIVIESAGKTLQQFPEQEQRVSAFDWLKT